MTTPQQGFLLTENMQDYHAFAHDGTCLSWSMLKKFNESPRRYDAVVTRRVPETDSRAFQMGRAFHLACEDIDEFYRKYCSDYHAPKNPKTGKPYGPTSQKYQDWQEEVESSDCIVIKDSDCLTVMKMAESFRNHPAASKLISDVPAVNLEKVNRAKIHGVVCQSRPDIYITNDSADTIIDLKTCKSISEFSRDIKKYYYVGQLAFYSLVAKAACGQRSSQPGSHPMSCYLIAVEKQPPYICGVWHIASHVMATAQHDMLVAIEAFSMVHNRFAPGNWPSNYESVREFYDSSS